MIYKDCINAMREVLENPYAKVAKLSDDYRLYLEGDQKLEAITYVLFTPLGVLAKRPDRLWQPKDQHIDLPMQVGILAPDKFLFWETVPELKAYLWDQMSMPAKPLYFVLFACFEGHAEAYMATPSIGAPIHFHWPSEKSEQLLGLCCEVIGANDPALGKQLRGFLLDVSSDICNIENE